MNIDSQLDSCPNDQPTSGLFSMLNFTGLQNFGFGKNQEEATNPPENISDVQLLDSISIQLGHTDRGAGMRQQGGMSERAEEVSVTDTRTERIDIEQSQSQTTTEAKKDESSIIQKTTEIEIAGPLKSRTKRNPLHTNLIQHPNSKNDLSGSTNIKLRNLNVQKPTEFKETMRKCSYFLKFFFQVFVCLGSYNVCCRI